MLGSITMHEIGGADRDRTGDLKLAKLALSQLSYGPNIWETAASRLRGQDQISFPARFLFETRTGGPGTTRTSDLTLIRRAL